MGLDTFTLFGRNDLPFVRRCGDCDGKAKWIIPSVAFLSILLVVAIFLNAPASSSSTQALVLLAEAGLAQYQGASIGIYDPVDFR